MTFAQMPQVLPAPGLEACQPETMPQLAVEYREIAVIAACVDSVPTAAVAYAPDAVGFQ